MGGGVLEHPAQSKAWQRFGLQRPRSFGGWTQDMFGGAWTCEVSQVAYGHRAQKLTWLYYVGLTPPPELDWSRPEHTPRVSGCENHGKSRVEIMGKKERLRTPLPFRDALLAMARQPWVVAREG